MLDPAWTTDLLVVAGRDGYWVRHSRDEAGNPLRDVQETLVRERRVRPADELSLIAVAVSEAGEPPMPAGERPIHPRARGLATRRRPTAPKCSWCTGQYDDWSLPKGKREPGEHMLLTAVREVFEETSVCPVLGPRLPHEEYLGPRPAQAGRLLVGDKPGAKRRPATRSTRCPGSR